MNKLEAVWNDRRVGFNMDPLPEPVCSVCGEDVKHCGPLVKGLQYGPVYTGLRHLPNLGDRRHGGRVR